MDEADDDEDNMPHIKAAEIGANMSGGWVLLGTVSKLLSFYFSPKSKSAFCGIEFNIYQCSSSIEIHQTEVYNEQDYITHALLSRAMDQVETMLTTVADHQVIVQSWFGQ